MAGAHSLYLLLRKSARVGARRDIGEGEGVSEAVRSGVGGRRSAVCGVASVGRSVVLP